MSTKEDIQALLRARENNNIPEDGSPEIDVNLTGEPFNEPIVDMVTSDILADDNVLTAAADGTGLLKTYFNKINIVVKDIITAISKLAKPIEELSTTELKTVENNTNITLPVPEKTIREVQIEKEDVNNKNKSILAKLFDKLKPSKKLDPKAIGGIGLIAGIALSIFKNKEPELYASMKDSVSDIIKSLSESLSVDKMYSTVKEALLSTFNSLFKGEDNKAEENVKTESTAIYSEDPVIQQAISEASAETGIDPYIIAGIAKTESNFDPNAESSVGAKGVMQFMPETWNEWGEGDINDPAANIKAGARYYKWLLDRHGGNKDEALAAYNWGTGNVANAKIKYGSNWLDYAPIETQNYITKNRKNANLLRNQGIQYANNAEALNITQGLNVPSLEAETITKVNPELQDIKLADNSLGQTSMNNEILTMNNTEIPIAEEPTNNVVVKNTNTNRRKTYIISSGLNNINSKRG